MSEEQDPVLLEAELEALKETANSLGINFHPNISYATLSERVEAHMAEQAAKDGLQAAAEQAPEVSEEPVVETSAMKMKRLKREQSALVRVRVSNVNPNKTEYPGEIFTVANKAVGTLRKYVPFDVDWHIPRIMLNVIQERQCQVWVNPGKKGHQGVGRMIKEFVVDILEPLSPSELKDLAQRQAMAAGTSE